MSFFKKLTKGSDKKDEQKEAKRKATLVSELQKSSGLSVAFMAELKQKTEAIRLLKLENDEWSDDEDSPNNRVEHPISPPLKDSGGKVDIKAVAGKMSKRPKKGKKDFWNQAGAKSSLRRKLHERYLEAPAEQNKIIKEAAVVATQKAATRLTLMEQRRQLASNNAAAHSVPRSAPGTLRRGRLGDDSDDEPDRASPAASSSNTSRSGSMEKHSNPPPQSSDRFVAPLKRNRSGTTSISVTTADKPKESAPSQTQAADITELKITIQSGKPPLVLPPAMLPDTKIMDKKKSKDKDKDKQKEKEKGKDKKKSEKDKKKKDKNNESEPDVSASMPVSPSCVTTEPISNPSPKLPLRHSSSASELDVPSSPSPGSSPAQHTDGRSSSASALDTFTTGGVPRPITSIPEETDAESEPESPRPSDMALSHSADSTLVRVPEKDDALDLLRQAAAKLERPTSESSLPRARPVNPRAVASPYGTLRRDIEVAAGKTVELTRRLGKGSFGTVWAGLLNGKPIALKQISLYDMSKDKKAQIRSQTKKEFDLVKPLRHENVLRYYGVFYSKESQEASLVMELVDGVSVADLVAFQKKLPEKLAAFILRQALDGLEYLHGNFIIHRDFKPDNMLIDANGKLKIIDFGCAAAASPDCITRRRSTVGTPWYCSPEVVNCDEYDFRADIWSVGCSAIELLSGKPPYDDLNDIACLFKMAEGSVPPFPEEISADCSDFLALALRVDPTSRPTAAELLSHPFLQLDADDSALALADVRSLVVEMNERRKAVTDAEEEDS